MCHWFLKPRVLLSAPLLLVLLLAVACGTSAPADPIVVEKEVIKEVIKEIVVEKEVIKEVPIEVVVEKVVVKEVIKEVVVVATPQSLSGEMTLGKSFSFPLRPAWVSKGKYKPMILEIALGTNPSNWDPQSGSSLYGTLIPTSPRFNQLVEYDPVNPTEVIGDLAESWEVSADGRVYTFRLHPAQWFDGKPVTAEDIKFSLDRIDSMKGRKFFIF